MRGEIARQWELGDYAVDRSEHGGYGDRVRKMVVAISISRADGVRSKAGGIRSQAVVAAAVCCRILAARAASRTNNPTSIVVQVAGSGTGVCIA